MRPIEPDLQRAVECLGDEHAAELRICLDVLRLESDIGIRRVAEARFRKIQDRRDVA
jgi:hypothetical protein